MQVNINEGQTASSADCHLEFSSYGDLSSLTWVANAPVPARLASGLVNVNVAYGIALQHLKQSPVFCCVTQWLKLGLHDLDDSLDLQAWTDIMMPLVCSQSNPLHPFAILQESDLFSLLAPFPCKVSATAHKERRFLN